MSTSTTSPESQSQALTSPPPALPITEFHLFSTLPVEIQLDIWDQAALIPNIVRYTKWTASVEHEWTIVGSTSPLLLTCQAARNAKFTNRGQVGNGRDVVRFNNEKDAILIDYEMIGRLSRGTIQPEQIKYLALYNFSFYADQWGASMRIAQISHLILDFPNLKGLFLVDPGFEEEEEGDSPPVEDWELAAMGMTLTEYNAYCHCIRVIRCRRALREQLLWYYYNTKGIRRGSRTAWWEDPWVEFVTLEELKKLFS